MDFGSDDQDDPRHHRSASDHLMNTYTLRLATGHQATYLCSTDSSVDPNLACLVLLHGASHNGHVLAPLLTQFAPPHHEGFNVIAPNLPGRLNSEGEPCATAAEAAAWLAQLMEALGIDNVVVAGHSFGGAIALEAALQAAQGATRWTTRLKGLALMATGARLRVHPAILAGAQQAVERGEPVYNSALVFGPDSDPERIAAYNRAIALTPPTTTWADWKACNRFDRLHQLASVGIPTHVFAGSDDPLTPLKYAQRLADDIEGATLTTCQGGHMFLVEQATEVADLLRERFAGLTHPT
ncbi:MAG: alpha/beta hydrolase [Myxococcota bacterium]